MGSLWIADHLRLRVPVVVKFIASELAGNPEVRARFEREAAATMAAKSPNVVQILDYGYTEQGIPFIAMELLEGEDLAMKIAREGRITPFEFAEILRQACKGLTRAHAQGIVHRDIKPENIFLSNFDGEIGVKVLDFGIAKADNAMHGLRATKTGVLLGTAYYMSPEQTMGAKNVDFRTDLWSLGVVTYYALTGVRPFESDSIGALVSNITSMPIAPPSHYVPVLGPAFDRWMEQALARDPMARFACAKDMAAAFDAAVAQSRETTGEDRLPTQAAAPVGVTPPGEWDYGTTPRPANAQGFIGPNGVVGATPPGEWDMGAGAQSRTRAPGTIFGQPAARWVPPHLAQQGGIPPVTGPFFPVVTSTPETMVQPKRTYTPYFVGVGIGVAVCVAFILFWGRSPLNSAQSAPAAAGALSTEARSTVDASALTAVPATERVVANAPGTSEPTGIATATDTTPTTETSVSRGNTSGSRTRSTVAKPKNDKRPAVHSEGPAHNDNPFNGTY